MGCLIAAVVVLSLFCCRILYQNRKKRLSLQLIDQKRFMKEDPNRLDQQALTALSLRCPGNLLS